MVIKYLLENPANIIKRWINLIERTWWIRTLTPSQFLKLSSIFKNSNFSVLCLPKSFLDPTKKIVLTLVHLTLTNFLRKLPIQLILHHSSALQPEVLSILLTQSSITNFFSCSMAKTRFTSIQQKRTFPVYRKAHQKTNLPMEIMKSWPLVLESLQKKLTIVPTLCLPGIV